jgi:tetratricopeptide (TPR) repeat protein
MKPSAAGTHARGWAGVAALVVTGCFSNSGTPATMVLREVPLPALEAADQTVRVQLQNAYAELMPRAEGTGSDAERGAAYGELGELLLAAALNAAAEPALLNARALAPGDVRWPYYLGHLYWTRGDASDAAAAFEASVRLMPDDLAAHVWLGRVYLSLGRPEEAAGEFSRALAVVPDDPAARAGLGQAALARGEFEAAVQEFERVLEMVPEATSTNYPLGLAYRGLGDDASAQRYLELRGDGEVPLIDSRMEALALVLDSALAFQRRGLDALNDGAWGEAAAQFRRGLAVAPTGDAALRVSLMHKLGSALWLVGDATGAVEQFEAGVSLSPEFAENYYSLGVIDASGGRLDEARRQFEGAIAVDGDYIEARIALGNVLRGLGQTTDALSHYVHALGVAPDAADARYAQAAALVELERYAEARRLLAEGLERHPNDARFPDALGALLGF